MGARRFVFRSSAVMALIAASAVIQSPRDLGAGLSPNDPRYPEQWNLARVNADDAWDVTQGSTAVRVALLDTGVGYGAIPADLVGNIGTGFNTFTGGSTTNDDYGTYGSGTANASVIGARSNNGRDVAGTSWNITILPVKVCDWNGQCPHANIAAGVNWAISRDVDIIQITPALATTTSGLTQAVAAAVNAGVLVVAPTAEPAIGVGYPGKLPGVIAVGASTSTDALASFSGGGPEIDLVAPGQSVLVVASGGCCITRSGSAIAASHVTGALALLLAEGIAPSQAAQRLIEGTVDLGPGGWDASFGSGRLDICRSLAAANGSCAIACDFDGNGWVDLADVLVVLQHYGETGTGLPWDLDGDGGVGLADAIITLNCAFSA